jgi:hypothetical protein
MPLLDFIEDNLLISVFMICAGANLIAKMWKHWCKSRKCKKCERRKKGKEEDEPTK